MSCTVTPSHDGRLQVQGHLFFPTREQADIANDKLKGTPSYDPLFRLKPLYDDIMMSCKAYYHLYQNIAIDVRMVALVKERKSPTRKCLGGFWLRSWQLVEGEMQCRVYWHAWCHSGLNSHRKSR